MVRRRVPLLAALLLAGCSGLDQVHKEILLNRITTAGEVVAAADSANAAGWRFEFAALRSDVSANLR
jgi:hypothetical protein